MVGGINIMMEHIQKTIGNILMDIGISLILVDI